MKYSSHNYEKLDQVHHGQRKLLLSEIQFLTNEYDKYKNKSNIIVVYITPGIGTHILYLIKLFPSFTYHLYDKDHINKNLYKLKNVIIYEEYFTDKIAKKYEKFK